MKGAEQVLRIAAALERTLRGQQGHLFAWCPVCLGLGIGLYFSLRSEPGTGVVLAILGMSLPLLVWALRDRSGFVAVPIALLLIGMGMNLAIFRAHQVAAPRLDMRYNGAVEGRVIFVDRSSSDALRLTLDQVVMYDLGPRSPPERVRISLHGKAADFVPIPLTRLSFRARMAPAAGPVEPRGFDFQRHAWFLRLGALGYTRAPPEVIETAPETLSVARLRFALSQGIQRHLDEDVGAFAAAISTGDRSGLLKDTTETLRTTNLAHLLAISGLHMGLLVGVVFAGLRYGMALWPWVALRIHVKKWAATGALIAAVGYLALSGASIATERAFVMAAVALVAVILDRRAISLRSVAIAALIVLAFRPESLLSPGFHMSFAATTALVWVFSILRGQHSWPIPSILRPVLALAVTSFIAGAATAPFAAAHFNGYAGYGLPANLLAVPMMGAVVMPSAVVALCLAPLGLEWIPLTVMGWGLQWILAVAEFFAALEGARVPIKSPPFMVVPVMTLGGLFVMLWQGRLRVLGVLPIAASAVFWVVSDRPLVLVDESSALVGVLTEEGRVLNKARRQGFAARSWLENDGDLADQKQAFQRFQAETRGLQVLDLGEPRLWVLSGKNADQQTVDCAPEDIIVTSKPLKSRKTCRVIDPKTMAKTGALAIHLIDRVLKITSVAQTRGQRLWSPEEQRQ